MAQEQKIQPDTLDFLFEYTRDAPAKQLLAADRLDGKIVQVFAAASVLLGLAAVRGGHRTAAVTALLVVAVVAYLGVVIASVCAVGVRQYKANNHADELWRRFWRDDVRDIKHALVASTSAAYEDNRTTLGRKGFAVQVAILATGVEAMAIGVAMLISTL